MIRTFFLSEECSSHAFPLCRGVHIPPTQQLFNSEEVSCACSTKRLDIVDVEWYLCGNLSSLLVPSQCHNWPRIFQQTAFCSAPQMGCHALEPVVFPWQGSTVLRSDLAELFSTHS